MNDSPVLAARVASMALIGLVAIQSVGFAATVTENSDPADASVTSAGAIIHDTDYFGRIGEYFDPGTVSVVMPFLLSNPSGDTSVATASLRFQLYTVMGVPADVDLYGLGVRSLPDVLISDFYSGTSDLTDATLLQQSILTSTTPIRIDPNTGFVTTSAPGEAALAAYLNDALAGGANTGKYAFLRFSYTLASAPPGDVAYNILTVDAGGSNERPLLTYTTNNVPEPSAWAGLILGFGLLLVSRRRRPSAWLGARFGL